MSNQGPLSAETRAPDSNKRDTALALRNALTLGLSLVATWSVALLVRLYLPRRLGPEVFGVYDFAESFAIAATAVLTFGIDTYIQKEVAVRPAHGSEFFGGISLLRFLISPILLAGCYIFLETVGRPPAAQHVALLYTAAQIIVITNSNTASLIQASCKVSGLAAINVGSKILWGASVATVLLLGKGLLTITAMLFCSEILRAAALLYLAKRHVGLVLRLDWKVVPRVLVTCLPLALGQFSISVYASAGRVILAKMTGDIEVGWYGAANNLTNIALFLAPLINSALLPVLSRAAARSEEDLNTMLAQSVELLFMISLPAALVMGLGADIWTAWLLGPAYAPSGLSLRIFSVLFVVEYISMLLATGLMQRGHLWWIAIVSLVGLMIKPVLGYLLLRPFAALFGPGGAAAGIALSVLISEVLIIGAYIVRLPRFPVSRQSGFRMAKALGACILVIFVHRFIAFLGAGALVLALLLYCALVLLSGAVKFKEMLQLARLTLKRDRQKSTPDEHGA